MNRTAGGSTAFVAKIGLHSQIARTTTLTSSLNPYLVGQAVTFTATVKGKSGSTPTGSVTFSHSGTIYETVDLVDGVATYTTSTLSAATGHPVTAAYNGSLTDAGSVSPTLAQAVLIPTKTSLASSLNPAVSGKAVTFTATVKATSGATPAGVVTFNNGTAVLGTGTLAGGVASFTTSKLPVGSLSITAAYATVSGGLDASSVSAVLTEVVKQ